MKIRLVSIALSRNKQQMAPHDGNNSVITECGVLDEHDEKKLNLNANKNSSENIPVKRNYEYKWVNILGMAFLHSQAIYGAYLAITGHAKWQTLLFGTEK